MIPLVLIPEKHVVAAASVPTTRFRRSVENSNRSVITSLFMRDARRGEILAGPFIDRDEVAARKESGILLSC